MHRFLLIALLFLAAGDAAAPLAFADASTLTGTLVERHGDRLGGTPTDRSFVVRSGDIERRLAGPQPAALVGQQVTATDRDTDSSGVQGTARAADNQTVLPAPAPGPRSLLVILVTTPDAPQASTSAAATRAAVFTGSASVNAFYRQQSGGATTLVGRVNGAGDVVGPVSIAPTLSGCRVDAVAAAADAAARAAGWAPDAYDHVVYALPSTRECAWAGLGDLPGRRTWVNGDLSNAAGVVSHELGHNVGAHHANTLTCSADGAPVTLSPSCTSKEYGDPFDVMGQSTRLMSSWHRAQAGQLPADQQVTVRSSQTVTLVSSDVFGPTGPRLLLVPRKEPRVAVQSWFAVEVRSPSSPFDTWPIGSPVTTGLSIRIVPDLARSEQTQLLDARPDTATAEDAALQPGETLRDGAREVTIRAEASFANTLRAVVTMRNLVDDVPPSGAPSVVGSGDTAGVRLSWATATDDEAVDHYEVERDGAIIGTTPSLGFQDDRVTALMRVTYRIVTVDRSGNRGTSGPVTLTLNDATPPSQVPGLGAAVTGSAVTVSWSAAQDNRGVSRYRVVRDGALLAEVAGTSYVDRPTPGRHQYELTAVDAAGNRGTVAATTAEVAAPAPSPSSGGGSPAAVSAPAGAGSISSALVSTPGPSTSIATHGDNGGSTPDIVLRSWRVYRQRNGRTIVMVFSAPGANAMRAYLGPRRIAKASGSRLVVRVPIRRHARRRTVRVVAVSEDGTTAATWVIR